MEFELLPSEALAVSEASRAAKLADISSRRAARSRIIPASEAGICQALRALGQPKCLFGEDLQDRRERLRAAMVAADVESFDEISKVPEGVINVSNKATGDVISAADVAPAEQKAEEFYTEGSKELRVLRLSLAKQTLFLGLKRLSAERQVRESTGGRGSDRLTRIESEARTVDRVRNGSIVLSQIGDVRPLSAVCIGPNPLGDASKGLLVVTGGWGGNVSIWRCDEQGTRLQCIDSHTARISTIRMPFEHPGLLLTSGEDGKAIVHSANDILTDGGDEISDMFSNRRGFAHEMTFTDHSQRVSDCLAHPLTRSVIVTTSFDGKFILYEDGRKLVEQETGHKGVCRGGFHPDGGLFGTCGLEGGLRIWDLRSGKAVMTMENAHAGSSTYLDFCNDGRVMASGGADNTIKIWDLRKRKMLYMIPAHLKLVSGVKFGGPGGDVLLSSSFDQTVKIWSARRGWALLKAHSDHEDKVTGVACSPDAQWIASACYDKTWKLWGYSSSSELGEEA